MRRAHRLLLHRRHRGQGSGLWVVGRNDFCVFIDHHAAHGVVNLRADFNAVERSLGNIEPLVERKDAVEVFVIVGFNVAVEF